ncbi:MAG: hypothetical protein ACRDG8_08945 [Actinomycetota bacterium]
MRSDYENELRDLLRDKAAEAPLATPSLPASAPPRVLRRGRLHQVGTVLGSAAVALVLIVGSVAGLQRLLGGGPDAFRTGEYEVFERTATIEAFTITSSSDTFLVNQWPLSMRIAVGSAGSLGTCTVGPDGNEVCEAGTETTERLDPPPFGLPMFQLSTADLGLSTIACGADLPADAAVLYVGLDYERAIFGALDPSIPAFSTGMDLGLEGDGPCGPGRYVTFMVGEEPFFAWIGVGSAAGASDRAVLEEAWETMSADDTWEPAPPPDEVTPAYVIAGGIADPAGPWRLELRSGRDVELTLVVAGTSGRLDVSLGTEPVTWCCRLAADPDRAAGLVIFGAVGKGATGVLFRPTDEREPIPGTILPLPPTLALDLDLFFIEGTAGIEGDVVALGLEDPASEPPPVAEPRGEIVEIMGSVAGKSWSVVFSGAFTGDESACIAVRIDGPPGHFCPDPIHTTLGGESPFFEGTLSPEFYLLAGSVPPEVSEIRFTSDDGTSPPTQFECRMGPHGWTGPDRKVCVLALPPEGSGIFEYLDTTGRVLFEEGMGWDSATAASHEYPWTNEAGFVTARGSFQGADWRIDVLHYLDGYRLTIDGRQVFEGRPFGLAEARAFPLFNGDRAQNDALVLVLTTDDEGSVSIVAGGRTWQGRWFPGSTVSGGKGRLWVLELPGAGTGSYWLDGNSLQGDVSWP